MGPIKDINSSRKASLNIEGNDAEDLLRNMTRNMPLKQDLAKLLNQTFRLEDERDGKQKKPKTSSRQQTQKPSKPEFSPQRFPSTFQIDVKMRDESGLPLVMLPAGSEKTIRFDDGGCQTAMRDFRSGAGQPGRAGGGVEVFTGQIAHLLEGVTMAPEFQPDHLKSFQLDRSDLGAVLNTDHGADLALIVIKALLKEAQAAMEDRSEPLQDCLQVGCR
jgi:hypothetical protein